MGMKWLLISIGFYLFVHFYLIPTLNSAKHEGSQVQGTELEELAHLDKQVTSPLPAIRAEPQSQAPGKEYSSYTDKHGDEVIIVPARYEAEPESAPIQAAPQVQQRSNQQRAPLVPLASQQVSQARIAPLQAAPPVNLTLVAMNAAANAHTGMNVFESCRCNNGLAAKGDLKQEVLDKCAQPVSRQFTGSRDCSEIWLYNFGPNEFMQGVCFDGNRVNKVLSLDHGYR
jgi:hypothetical protein